MLSLLSYFFCSLLQLIKILLENGSCTLHVHYNAFVFTVGSQFRNPGLFEVTKATNSEDKIEQSSTNNRALEVTVGSDLEGTAEVRVAIVTSGEQLETASVRGKNLVPLVTQGMGRFRYKCDGVDHHIFLLGVQICGFVPSRVFKLKMTTVIIVTRIYVVG